MIENVEELRSELGVKGFGDFGNREVLEYGEINGGKTRPVEFVATGVTQNVGTILLASRCRDRCFCKGQRGAAKGVCRSGQWKRSGSSRWREASGVEIVDAAVNCLAAGNDTRVVHGEVTVEPGAERVVTVASRDREGSTGGCRDDGADLPATRDISLPTVLWSGDIPNDSARKRLADIEVASPDSLR